METCSQKRAIGPYLEPTSSQPIYIRSILNIRFSSMARSPSCPLSFQVMPKMLYIFLILPAMHADPGQLSRYRGWLRAGRPRGRSSCPGRGKIFLLSTSFRPILGLTQSPIQWEPVYNAVILWCDIIINWYVWYYKKRWSFCSIRLEWIKQMLAKNIFKVSQKVKVKR
jgi:hypothetical protein